MVRSFDILLFFVGGGPSLSVFELESIPSGAGEPVCDECCDEIGEGYGMLFLRIEGGKVGISGGGDMLMVELRSENGEDDLLSGSDDNGEDDSIVSIAMLAKREGADAVRKVRVSVKFGRY